MDSSSNESMQHSVDMLHTLQHFLEKSPTSASRMHRAMEAGHGVPREDVGCSKHLVHSDSKPNGAALCLPPPPLSHTRGKICSCDTTSSASSTYCPSQGSSCCDSASPSFVRSDARAQQDSFRRRKLGASADNALLIAVEQILHQCSPRMRNSPCTPERQSPHSPRIHSPLRNSPCSHERQSPHSSANSTSSSCPSPLKITNDAEQLNEEFIVLERREWVKASVHTPPAFQRRRGSNARSLDPVLEKQASLRANSLDNEYVET